MGLQAVAWQPACLGAVAAGLAALVLPDVSHKMCHPIKHPLGNVCPAHARRMSGALPLY